MKVNISGDARFTFGINVIDVKDCSGFIKVDI